MRSYSASCCAACSAIGSTSRDPTRCPPWAPARSRTAKDRRKRRRGLADPDGPRAAALGGPLSRSLDAIEDVRQPGAIELALVGEAELLEHAPRRAVGRGREGGDLIEP